MAEARRKRYTLRKQGGRKAPQAEGEGDPPEPFRPALCPFGGRPGTGGAFGS